MLMKTARTPGMRCITRISIPGKSTRGWEVRVVRRGIAINEFFSDKTFGGRAGALSEAMHRRDEIVRDLRPIPRFELARKITARNSSGIVGVHRRIKPTRRGDTIFEYPVWTATGSVRPGERKVRDFYVGKLGEDDAREAAIQQRLRWEKQMERFDRTNLRFPRR